MATCQAMGTLFVMCLGKPVEPADMFAMALFTWDPRLAIEVPEIDDEHAQLFAAADQLHAAIGQGVSKESVRAHLASLIDHSQAHFAHEEQLMIRCGYPEFQEHKAQHKYLMERILQFQRDFVPRRAALEAAMLRFLKDWLIRHIDESDRKIAAHLHSASATAATRKDG